MRWLGRLLPGRVRQLTVRADEVRLGDYIDWDERELPAPPRQPVVEITNYGGPERSLDPTVYLTVNGRYGYYTRLCHPDDPVTIERRTRP